MTKNLQFVEKNAVESVDSMLKRRIDGLLVAGFSLEDKSVREAREWVHPIVQYCEMNKALNLTMPTIDVSAVGNTNRAGDIDG